MSEYGQFLFNLGQFFLSAATILSHVGLTLQDDIILQIYRITDLIENLNIS